MFDYLDAAYEALTSLRATLPALHHSIHGGTRRRSTTGDLPATARAARDQRLRAERHDRETMAASTPTGMVPIGASRAPADLTALDALRDIELDLAELEAAVIARTAPELRPAPGTAARIRRLIDLLAKIGALPDLARHVSAETRRLDKKARAAIGDTEPIHRLDARCPICSAKSLRAFTDRMLILCVNQSCECSDWLCSCRDEHRPGRHQWSYGEWAGLAKKLDAA